MTEFLYLRLIGLCNIADGLAMLFSPFRPRLSLRAAKRLARHRGQRTMKGGPV